MTDDASRPLPVSLPRLRSIVPAAAPGGASLAGRSSAGVGRPRDVACLGEWHAAVEAACAACEGDLDTETLRGYRLVLRCSVLGEDG